MDEGTAQRARRRRDAVSRCEPFDCGHWGPLNCQGSACSEPTPDGEKTIAELPEPETPTVEPGDFAGLWADARISFFAKDFPKYASAEWRTLPPDDPRRIAGALEAAELWRRYGDEQELCDWLRRLSTSPEALARGRALAELDALARPKPAHQLRATPGWPPIRVPGQPGRYLYPQEGRRAA